MYMERQPRNIKAQQIDGPAANRWSIELGCPVVCYISIMFYVVYSHDSYLLIYTQCRELGVFVYLASIHFPSPHPIHISSCSLYIFYDGICTVYSASIMVVMSHIFDVYTLLPFVVNICYATFPCNFLHLCQDIQSQTCYCLHKFI